jgi:hypothetical protein
MPLYKEIRAGMPPDKNSPPGELVLGLEEQKLRT